MRQNLAIIANHTSLKGPRESTYKDTGFRFLSAGVVPSSRTIGGQFCSLIGAPGLDQVLGWIFRIGNLNLRQSHMRLLTFRKVNVEREAFCLTVPIDAGSGTVSVNRPPDCPFKVSKVVTVAQRFGRLSNIHGQSVSLTGNELERRLILTRALALRVSIFGRNQADRGAGFRLKDGLSGIRIAVWNTGASVYNPMFRCK